MAEDWTTKRVDKYVVVNKKLGQGAYGVVYRGFFAEDESRQVAVKTIPIKIIQDSPKMLELIKREIALLQKINHPNIVRLYDVARTSNYLYMFLEFCQDGDLKEFLSKKEEKRLSELEAVIFLKHIVEGFKNLYAIKIIHRDIKPANILLNQGVAKITDFGFARVIETEMNDPAYLSRLGSPLYMAPQILESQPFSAKCDVWSVGIMFYELLYGRTPWTGENQFNLLENIKKQPLRFPPKPVRSQKVKELIQQMLVVNDRDRITWEGVFNNPTIKIDENKIKENMEAILREKDQMIKSIQMNKLYMEQNLVVGYLAHNPINSFDGNKSMEKSDEARRSSAQMMSQYDNEHDDEIIMSNYRNEKKKRDALLKYNSYFLFERNIAFFFNFVIQKVIKLQTEKVIDLETDNYFRLIYLIAKNQIIHLDRINRQLGTKDHEKFDRETWGKYLASQEYQKINDIIKKDMDHSKEFFYEIAKKTNEIQKVVQEHNPSNTIVKKFMEIFNPHFETSEAFHHVYREVIQSNADLIRKSQLSRDSQLLYLYFQICLNPYLEFKEIYFDFNKFYEEYENMPEPDIQELFNKPRQ